MALTALLDADGLSRLGYDEDSWWAFVEQVAQTLDIGPGSRVWDAACGAGSFLFPLHRNGFIVGGVHRSSDHVALASTAMPDGQFLVGTSPGVAPPGRWDVVVASQGLTGCGDVDEVRALLSQMVAHAAHAVAVLDADDGQVPGADQAAVMRALAGAGVAAVQFETGPNGRWHVFARVGTRS